MVHLTVGYVAGFIAAGIFIGRVRRFPSNIARQVSTLWYLPIRKVLISRLGPACQTSGKFDPANITNLYMACGQIFGVPQ